MKNVSPAKKRGRFPMMICVVCCALSGCLSPGVMKLAKPVPKPSQEEFSCGEKCPPSLKSMPLTDRPH